MAGTNLGFGIANAGHDDVTITGGTIQGFDAGVMLGSGTAGNVVSHLTLELHELAGVQLVNADDGGRGNIVRDNLLAGNGNGVDLGGGTEFAVVRDNVVAGTAGVAVLLVDAHRNRVAGNELTGSSDTTVLLEGATHNDIVGNTIVGAADTSVVIHLDSDHNLIQGNEMSEGEAGVSIEESDHNEVLDNVAHGMGDNGISLEDAHDNVVRGNDVRFNTGGMEVSGSTGNRIEANDASQSTGCRDRIRRRRGGQRDHRQRRRRQRRRWHRDPCVRRPRHRQPDRGQHHDDNTGDGISVADVGHMIRGNSASNNSEWGIEAADATILGMNLDRSTTGSSPASTSSRCAPSTPTSASTRPPVYEWTYVALDPTDPPDTSIDVAQPAMSPLIEGIFTFSGGSSPT